MRTAKIDRKLVFFPNTEELEKEWCEIEEACEPILEYLKKCNPYVRIVVNIDSIEVVQISGRAIINKVD